MSMVTYLAPGLYPAAPIMPHTPKGPVATPPIPGNFKASGPGYKPDENREIAGLRFHVVIDGKNLGNWFKVDGLSVKFEIAEYRSGDGRNRRWIEPAYTTYANVKLSRSTALRYTSRILEWLQETSFNAKKNMTAEIFGYPLWHDKASTEYIVSWKLTGVLPVAWSGPQFDATSGKLATETLELAHEGFLDPER